LSHCVDAKQVFTITYSEGYWGKSTKFGDKYYSGSGSYSNEIAGGYVLAIIAFVESLRNNPVVVDLGCVELAVGERNRSPYNRYIAV
jgi:hypothetical protein